MRAAQTIPRRRPLASEFNGVNRPIKDAAARIGVRSGRFGLYDFLEAIYRVYIDWRRRKTAKRSDRAMASKLALVTRKGMIPIRVLIEATLPDADFKQKSRWVRALEYVHSEDVSPLRFRRFIGGGGGGGVGGPPRALSDAGG